MLNRHAGSLTFRLVNEMLKEADEHSYCGQVARADPGHKECGVELVWAAGHSASILN